MCAVPMSIFGCALSKSNASTSINIQVRVTDIGELFGFLGGYVPSDEHGDRQCLPLEDGAPGCLAEVNGVLQTIATVTAAALASDDFLFIGGDFATIDDPIDVGSVVCFESAADFENLTFTTCGPENCDFQDCVANPGFNIENDSFYCEDCRIVSKTNDYYMGSLRFAIVCTPPSDTVHFDVGVDGQLIEIESDSILITKSLVIRSDFSRNITLTNADPANLVPLLIFEDEVVFHGLKIIGKTDDSMIFKIMMTIAIIFINIDRMDNKSNRIHL